MDILRKFHEYVALETSPHFHAGDLAARHRRVKEAEEALILAIGSGVTVEGVRFTTETVYIEKRVYRYFITNAKREKLPDAPRFSTALAGGRKANVLQTHVEPTRVHTRRDKRHSVDLKI